ncbi:MAG: ribosome biogenesis GTPase Der [Spirochaetes bacterium]|nr:ribosome biogenesis GTPase Der [Spirochaetota bacterium]
MSSSSKSLPVVTILGRQNVGKSTLFNALIREKKAIVDSLPGLTRDIINYNVSRGDVSFILSDTPGMDITDSSELSQSILENARRHLEKSSVIILLLENPNLMAFDVDLHDIIRKLGIPIIIAVNKMDSGADLENMSNFYEMGCSDILPISAVGRRNIDLLLDKIAEALPVRKAFTEKIDMKISIIGRPNSGKSTLLNALIGENRSVVSDVPGTTRDSIDENFTFQGKRIKIIDTAGLGRKSKIKEDVQFYSMKRTVESIAKSDVVIHLIDAVTGITETDQKISDEILKANKPIIIAVNKWDAISRETNTFKEFTGDIIYKMYRAEDFPIISISAKDKLRIHKLMMLALDVNEKARRRIETPRLNKIIETVQKTHATPVIGGTLKIFYATQIDTVPPQFKFFVNYPELVRKDVIRFLQKLLQRELDIKGVPVIIHIEGRKKREKKG